jgi:hypothetical protein
MALVARTYPDPLSTEEGGSVMLGIENRTPDRRQITGHLST